MATSRPLPIALELCCGLSATRCGCRFSRCRRSSRRCATNFSLSGTEIGILTGLPIIVFAAAALGRLAAGRRGLASLRRLSRAWLLTALRLRAVAALASDVRERCSRRLIVMGAGVAVTQPAMPALVGRWLPRHIGLGTGIYTNGLLVGEILPVALFPRTVPRCSAIAGARPFVLWGGADPSAIALLVVVTAPRDAGRAGSPQRRRWWPDWPARDIWRLGPHLSAARARSISAATPSCPAT